MALYAQHLDIEAAPPGTPATPLFIPIRSFAESIVVGHLTFADLPSRLPVKGIILTASPGRYSLLLQRAKTRKR